MARPEPRTLHVISSRSVTPNMLRVTLGGAGMAQFPAEQAGAYIKLMYPQPGSDRPLMRTYTVRSQRKGEIDVDFVLHEDAGPASAWARGVKPGDAILVGGPGPRKLVDASADWFLLAADMTALPALSVNLELLPADARGHALIEVIDEADIQSLVHPAGIELHWLVNPHPGERPTLLADAVRALEWLPGNVGAWAACEFSSMRELRKVLRDEHPVERGRLYISSYWKRGSSEDQHKVIKREDAEALGD
jgi:NADPH-dependent ferric siderophore reductase